MAALLALQGPQAPERLDVPSAPIEQFKLVTFPAYGRATAWCDAESAALAARGARSVPELRRRLVGGLTRAGRFAAASGLGRIVPEGRDALVRLLRATDDEELRLACLAGLPAADEASIDAAARWHWLPEEPDDTWEAMGPVGPLASCGTGRWDPAAMTTDGLVAAILDEEPELGARVLDGLLASADAGVRRRAAWALRLLLARHDLALSASLDDLGADADPIVRLAALARPCADAGDPTALEARRALSLRAARDPDPLVRDAGLLGFTCDEEPSVPRDMLPLLRALARDEGEPDTRRSVAASLALTIELGEAELGILLATCGGGEDCVAGLDAVRRQAAVTVPWLESMALTPGPAQRGALETLQGMGRPLPVERCGQVVSSPDPAVRTSFVDMVATRRPIPDGALACIRPLLEDPVPCVRVRAAGAVPLVAPNDVAAIRRAAAVVAGLPQASYFTFAEEASHATLAALAAEGTFELRRSAWCELARRAPTRDAALDVTWRARTEAPAEAHRAILTSLERRKDLTPQDLLPLRQLAGER